MYQQPLSAASCPSSPARSNPAADRRRHARAARRAARPRGRPAPDRSERDRNPPRLSLRLSYTQALQEAGAIAVVLPAHGFVDDVAPLLDRLDGLLFSGGPDLDPATYGHERHPLLGPDVDRVSDEYELALLREATARDLPLLAICRGMQALNVARGGTLHQHLPDRTHARAPPDARAVRARARGHGPAGSPLHRLTRRRRLEVNSFHHQAVDELGAAARPVRPRAGRHDRGALRPAAALLPRRPVARRAAHAPRRARPAAARAGGRGEHRRRRHRCGSRAERRGMRSALASVLAGT